MAKTIDTKVVEMRFDNSQFESGAKQSMKTMDDLANSTSALEKIADALSSVGSAISDGTISEGLSWAQERFSAFGIFTARIVENLADTFYNKLGAVFSWVGDQIQSVIDTSVFSTESMNAGWDKYAKKTEAVQTIMAATAYKIGQVGEDGTVAWSNQEEQMEGVNEQLSKLNWFTDETSYNFTEMVSNIGKFTSAGIDLDDSVTAMQGIATWAAKSGAGIEGANRAMYNLSQAMAMGAVKSQDWMSIENANMATKEFKEMVIQAGLANGNLRKIVKNGKEIVVDAGLLENEGKEVEVTFENFKSTLSSGWFTSSTLTDVLNQYGSFTDKLYEFSDSFNTTTSDIVTSANDYAEAIKNGDEKKKEKLIEELAKSYDGLGDPIEETTKLLEELSKEEYYLGRSSFTAAQEAKTFKEAMDSITDAASTKWMNIFESIFGDYMYAKKLWTSLANGLYDIFVAPLDPVLEGLQKWLEMGESASLVRDKFFNGFKKLGSSVLSIFEPIIKAFRAVMGISDDANERYASVVEHVKMFMSNLSNYTFRIAQNIDSFMNKHGDSIFKLFKGIFDVVSLIGSAIGAVVKGVLGAFGAIGGLGGSALDAAGSFGELLSKFADFVRESKVFEKVANVISTVISDIIVQIKWYLSDLSVIIYQVENGFKSFGRGVMDVISDLIMLPLYALARILEDLFGINIWDKLFVFEEKLYELSEVILNVFSKLWKWLEPVRVKMGELFGELKTYVSDGSLANDAANVFTKMKDAIVALWDWLEPVRNLIGSLFGFIKDSVSKMDFSWFTELGKKMSEASNPIEALGILFDELSAKVTECISNIQPHIENFSNTLRDKLGAGLREIWDFVKNFDFKNLVKFLKLLFGLKTVKSIWDFTDAFGKAGDMFKRIGKSFTSGAKSFQTLAKNYNKEKISDILMALAILIGVIAASIILLSHLDPEKMTTALAGMSIILAELVVVMALIAKANGESKEGIGETLKGMAIAIGVIALAVMLLASLDLKNLQMATVAMGVILLAIAAFIYVISDTKAMSKDVGKIGKVLIMASIAIYIIAKAMEQIAQLDTAKIIACTIAIGTIMAMIIAMSVLASNSELGVGFGVTMILVAAGIAVVADALVTLGRLDIKKLMVIVGGLVVLVAIIGVVAVMLSKTKKNVEKEVKVSSFAANMAALALAMIAFAAAVAIITISLAKLVSLDMEKAAIGLLLLVTAFAAMAGLSVLLGEEGCKNFERFGIAVALIGAGVFLAVASIALLLEIAPKVVAASDMISKAIIIIVEAIIVGLANGIVEFLNLLGESSERILDALTVLVTDITNGIVPLVGAIIDLVLEVLDAVIDRAEEIGYKITELVLELLYGVVDAIRNEIPSIVEELFGILIDLINAVGEYLSDEKNEKAIWDAIDNLLVGLCLFGLEAVERLKVIGKAAWDAIKEGFSAAWNWLKNSAVGEFFKIAGQIILGFIKGLAGAAKKIWDAISWPFKEVIRQIKALFGIHSPSTVFAEIGGYVIQGFINGAKAIWDTLVEWFTTAWSTLKNIVLTIFGFDESGGNVFLDYGFNLINAFWTGIKNVWESFYEFFTGIWNALKTFFLDLFGFNGDDAQSSAFLNFGTNLIQSIWDGISGLWEAFFTYFSDIWNAVKTFFMDLFGFGEDGESSNVFVNFGIGIISSIWNGIEGIWTTFYEFFAGIWKSIKQFFMDLFGFNGKDAQSSAFLNFGKNIIQSVWDGIKGLWDSFFGFFSGIWDSIIEFFDELIGTDGDLFSAGSDIITSIWDGMKEVFGKVFGWFTQKIYSLVTFIQSLPEEFIEGGKNLVLGIRDGVIKAWHIFTDWLKKKLGDIYETFCSALNMHSPSRLMAYGGKMVVAGIKVGINDNLEMVDSAMENVAESVLSPLGEIIDDADSMTENGINPSITPVIDMDNAKSIGTLADLMSGGNVRFKVDDQSIKDLAVNMEDATCGKSIVEAINSMRDEMAEYSEAIKNIKMVVNSKALVGEIVSDMDYALGGRAALAGRGL